MRTHQYCSSLHLKQIPNAKSRHLIQWRKCHLKKFWSVLLLVTMCCSWTGKHWTRCNSQSTPLKHPCIYSVVAVKRFPVKPVRRNTWCCLQLKYSPIIPWEISYYFFISKRLNRKHKVTQNWLLRVGITTFPLPKSMWACQWQQQPCTVVKRFHLDHWESTQS